ncbi:MAG: hypothetical protein AABY22_31335 [Nanoarchaeota archaeon]
MLDYNAFDEMVKEKKKKSKFFSMDIDDTQVFTLLSLDKAKMINNFSGEMEDVWVYLLEDEDKNQKTWDTGSLKVFSQFKENEIQEGDRIRITCVLKGKNKNYVIEPLKGK